MNLDEYTYEAAKNVVLTRSCSSAMLQGNYRIGFTRATRIINELEMLGIISSEYVNNQRQVIVDSVDDVDEIMMKYGVIKTSKNSSIGNIEQYGLDPLLMDAILLAITKGKCSSGMFQRCYKIGFNRAANLVDTLAAIGIVGPQYGTMPRSILVCSRDEALNLLEKYVKLKCSIINESHLPPVKNNSEVPQKRIMTETVSSLARAETQSTVERDSTSRIKELGEKAYNLFSFKCDTKSINMTPSPLLSHMDGTVEVHNDCIEVLKYVDIEGVNSMILSIPIDGIVKIGIVRQNKFNNEFVNVKLYLSHHIEVAFNDEKLNGISIEKRNELYRIASEKVVVLSFVNALCDIDVVEKVFHRVAQETQIPCEF